MESKEIEAFLDRYLDESFRRGAASAEVVLAHESTGRERFVAATLVRANRAHAHGIDDLHDTRQHLEVVAWRGLERCLEKRYALAIRDVDAAVMRPEHQRAQDILDHTLRMLAAVRIRLQRASAGREGFAGF